MVAAFAGKVTVASFLACNQVLCLNGLGVNYETRILRIVVTRIVVTRCRVYGCIGWEDVMFVLLLAIFILIGPLLFCKSLVWIDGLFIGVMILGAISGLLLLLFKEPKA